MKDEFYALIFGGIYMIFVASLVIVIIIVLLLWLALQPLYDKIGSFASKFLNPFNIKKETDKNENE